MSLSILQNFVPSMLRAEPFPHLVIQGALNERLYAQLEAEYPFETEIRGYSGFANNTRYQISSVDALRETHRVSALWREFIAFHTSTEFLHQAAEAFAPFADSIPISLKDSKPGIRFRDSVADVWMDCQPGINSPVTATKSVKGPHLDHPSEIFAALLYFRHPDDKASGGDLELYELTVDNPKFFGHRFIRPRYIRKTAVVPYSSNTLVMFLNTARAIHGVSPRSLTPYTRRLCNFVAELNPPQSMFNIRYERKSPWRAAMRRLESWAGSAN